MVSRPPQPIRWNICAHGLVCFEIELFGFEVVFFGFLKAALDIDLAGVSSSLGAFVGRSPEEGEGGEWIGGTISGKSSIVAL